MQHCPRGLCQVDGGALGLQARAGAMVPTTIHFGRTHCGRIVRLSDANSPPSFKRGD